MEGARGQTVKVGGWRYMPIWSEYDYCHALTIWHVLRGREIKITNDALGAREDLGAGDFVHDRFSERAISDFIEHYPLIKSQLQQKATRVVAKWRAEENGRLTTKQIQEADRGRRVSRIHRQMEDLV